MEPWETTLQFQGFSKGRGNQCTLKEIYQLDQTPKSMQSSKISVKSIQQEASLVTILLKNKTESVEIKLLILQAVVSMPLQNQFLEAIHLNTKSKLKTSIHLEIRIHSDQIQTKYTQPMALIMTISIAGVLESDLVFFNRVHITN